MRRAVAEAVCGGGGLAGDAGASAAGAQPDGVVAKGSPSFPVAERFASINGEGLAAGRPAAFIRFAGCNLDCSYCDTRWANEPGVPTEMLGVRELVEWVRGTGLSCVTLTGGEPMLQPGLRELAVALMGVGDPKPLRVEVETNGSVSTYRLRTARMDAADQGLPGQLALTVDCKTPSSGNPMGDEMMQENFSSLDGNDSVKFVVGSREDLEFMERTVLAWRLCDRCAVLASPVWGRIEPADIAGFLVERRLDRVRLQLQLHKIVWPGEERGV